MATAKHNKPETDEVKTDISSDWDDIATATETAPVGKVPTFKIKAAVTRPVLKFGVAPEYIHIESAMVLGEKMEGAKIKELPTLMDVINISTGESMLIVCATVFRQELHKAYPNDTYVNKDFMVRKIKTSAKNYAIWAITEIELTK